MRIRRKILDQDRIEAFEVLIKRYILDLACGGAVVEQALEPQAE